MRGLRGERGQATVEFALVLPVFLLLVVGILEFAKAFNYWDQTSQVAADTARWVVVNQLPAYTNASGTQVAANASPTVTDYRNFAFAQLVSKNLRDSTPNQCTSTTCGVQFCFAPPANQSPGAPVSKGWAVTVNLKTRYRPLALVTSKFLGTQINLKGSATMRIELPPTQTLAKDAGCP